MEPITAREFRKVLRDFERELATQNQSGCCCGVTVTQCHTLMVLDAHEGITLNDLATRVKLDKSTVSRIVDSLVRSGYINRTIPQQNRRTTIVSLTAKGREACQTINSGNDAYYDEVLTAIPENLRTAFLDGFRMMTATMAKLNQPSCC